MYPALQNLKDSGKYILAALSNTVIFPPNHPFNNSHSELRSLFDIFISSAHVGMRKPDPAIYDFALKSLDAYAKENASPRTDSGGRDKTGWEKGIKPEDIVFLDDIGENLKAAKNAGFGTIKVHLGRAFEAVDALEELTGLQLAGTHPKVPIVPRTKARL
jgi:FMN phosphatase YigB (HAD superfamily)